MSNVRWHVEVAPGIGLGLICGQCPTKMMGCIGTAWAFGNEEIDKLVLAHYRKYHKQLLNYQGPHKFQPSNDNDDDGSQCAICHQHFNAAIHTDREVP